ncbi:FK506-binding protein [Enhygromyxa salina]|uniref:Peptidyl-prolyl cis-trans isomerase n=1 Tax=Enhygromyxa salina TaxID=215803 RepID=A0A2S9YED6_9BACT|nr:FKBP-type peptidyl-prolyl cis-trans isomerase [Enhygromyxa salina]PRQ03480.1 FK506-binding protein [Enhygromyxa salina]
MRRWPVPVLALALVACAKQPAPRDAYEGAPQRAAIVAECGPKLVDDEGRACVQIDVFAEGEGPPAAPGEWLWIHYIVTLPNGAQIDSSHERKPLSLRLGHSGEVIEGMHLGLAGIRVGERRRFVVPPKLGYRGAKMAGVPPDANLTFLVELMERRESL